MKPRLMLLRLALSLLSGLCVTMICLKLVVSGSGSFYLRYPQTATRDDIDRISKAIEVYRQKKGALPATLKRIGDVPAAQFSMDGMTDWPDNFGHPFIYRVQGKKYQLISLGADGKTGGIGLDCDLSKDNLHPPQAEIPLWQLVIHPDARGMVNSSAICGLLVAIITFFSLKTEDFRLRDWEKLTGQLIFLIIATGFVSFLITSVHIPSGH